MNNVSMLAPVLALVVVLAAIPVALWLLKRSGVAGVAAQGVRHAPARLLHSLALAPGQRIVTVEVGQGNDRQWLVVGVSQAGLRTLHVLPPQEPVADAAAAPAPGFAALFARAQRGTGA